MINTTTPSKISQENILKIIDEHENGTSITKLSKKYNVTYNSIYYHISKNRVIETKQKRKKIFKQKGIMKINQEEIEIDEINLDRNIIKFVNNFFLNLFLNIEKPTRVITRNTKESKTKWYNNVLKWSDEEEFWFDMYEEYLGYNGNNLRKIIKNKIKEKIEKL